MIRPSITLLSLASLSTYCGPTGSSALSIHETLPSRRAFFRTIPIAFVATATATAGCQCFSCMPGSSAFLALAYERRDVGGENPSPEIAAMNLQAYQTMNRLERDGLKLETSAEQRASLTAALSDYAYQPTSSSSRKDKNATKPKKPEISTELK